MSAAQSNPFAGFNSQEDNEGRYENTILKYLLNRYNVARRIKNQLYDNAEAIVGSRQPTISMLEQLVPLPIMLRARIIVYPTGHLTVPTALNGKALAGYIGKTYRDVRDSFPDLVEMNYVIGMCFGYPYLHTPGSAASLVIHDATPTLDEISEARGIILIPGDTERSIWAIEPLGQLLDRLDVTSDD